MCVSRLRLSVAKVTHRVGVHDKIHRFAIQTTQFEASKTMLQTDSDQCGCRGFPQERFATAAAGRTWYRGMSSGRGRAIIFRSDCGQPGWCYQCGGYPFELYFLDHWRKEIPWWTNIFSAQVFAEDRNRLGHHRFEDPIARSIIWVVDGSTAGRTDPLDVGPITFSDAESMWIDDHSNWCRIWRVGASVRLK